MLNIDNYRVLSQSELAEASETNVVRRAVEAGEEISFGVVMKAPERVGTAISYWRLKTAGGLPFGHRLWCHIEVTNPITPPVVPLPVAACAPPPPPPVPAHSGPTTSEASSSHGAITTPEPRSELSPRRLGKSRAAMKQTIKQHFELKRKAHDAVLQAMREQAVLGMPEVIPAQKEEAAQLPVEEPAVEEPAVDEVTKSSDMIFPQLEKESPASSTHEAASQAPEMEEAKEESITEVNSTEHSDEEFFEDAESVEIRSLSSDGDEGFMTDEEYDILNASDEEAA
jgi:next-to-BRCA1 protein 1